MKIHPHMLRHACGYKLANDGVDTRTIQGYLGTSRSSTRCATPSCHRPGLRAFGGTERFFDLNRFDNILSEADRIKLL